MAMTVRSKTAIITGAGSGINYCFASLLLSKGCNVLIADLQTRPESEALLKKYPITAASGPRAVFQEIDVTDWAQLPKMFDAAVEHFGGADIVCPGAGIYEPPFSNFWSPPGNLPSRDDPAGSRYAILDINITHPIRTTQLAIDHFIKLNRPGVVVHISSVAGQIPSFPTPMYVASKFAISGFVRSLYRLEKPPAHLPKIRVNAVAPGLIKTPLWTEHPEKMKWVEDVRDLWVTPEDVAKVMLDLVEKEENVGGTILEIGGKSVRKVKVFGDTGPVAAGNAGHHTAPDVENEVWTGLTKLKAKI